MVGALVLAFVIVVVIPVGFLITMGIVSGILGFAIKSDVEARHAGSELIDCNT